MTLGLKIKQLRLERDWSQDELANFSGVSRSYISKLERELNMAISMEFVVKLARGFGIDLQILLTAAGFRIPIPGEDEPISNVINNPELRQWLTFQNLNNLSPTIQRVIVMLVQTELGKSFNFCEGCQGSGRNQEIRGAREVWHL